MDQAQPHWATSDFDTDPAVLVWVVTIERYPFEYLISILLHWCQRHPVEFLISIQLQGCERYLVEYLISILLQVPSWVPHVDPDGLVWAFPGWTVH